MCNLEFYKKIKKIIIYNNQRQNSWCFKLYIKKTKYTNFKLNVKKKILKAKIRKFKFEQKTK